MAVAERCTTGKRAVRILTGMLSCTNAFVIVFSVYDSGTCFSPAILDITDDDLRATFMEVSTKL